MYKHIIFRAAEQLIGLPDETADERQHGAMDESEHSPSHAGEEQEFDPWLQGRIIFAKTLMDVGSCAFGCGGVQCKIKVGHTVPVRLEVGTLGFPR